MNTLTPVVRYTLRTAAPTRRLLLVLPSLAAVLFGLLARLPHMLPENAFAAVAGGTIFGLVMPITCLIIGDAAMGSEVRSGTFAFTWLSPVSLSTIMLGRWIGACVIAWTLLVPGVVVAAIVAGVPGSIGPAVLATVFGCAAYLAIFLTIGVTFSRPIVWSLTLVILIEGLLGAALSGIAELAPGWLARAVLVGLTLPRRGIIFVVGGPPSGAFRPQGGPQLHRDGVPEGWAGVVRLALLAAVVLFIGIRRLRKLKPASASD